MAIQHPNEYVETLTTETRHGDLTIILRELADRCAALTAAGQQIKALEIGPAYSGRSSLAAYRIRLSTSHGRQQAPAGLPHPCPDCEGRGFRHDCSDGRCETCDGRGWLAQPAAPEEVR